MRPRIAAPSPTSGASLLGTQADASTSSRWRSLPWAPSVERSGVWARDVAGRDESAQMASNVRDGNQYPRTGPQPSAEHPLKLIFLETEVAMRALHSVVRLNRPAERIQ